MFKSNRRSALPVIILSGFLLLTLACQSGGGNLFTKSGPTLATVNGVKITQGEVDAMLKRLPERARAFYQNPQAQSQLVESLVNNELLFQEAKRRGIDKKPDVEFQVESTKRSVYARFLLDEMVAEKTRDEVLQKAYDSDEKYRAPQVKPSHILVKDQKLANKIYKELKGGADFATLAKKYSEDPSSKEKGGDLDWIDQTRMVKPFTDAAFALKVGELSQPVKTNFGYHIIKVTERREATPFEEAKEKIRQDVARSIQGDVMAELKKSAKIEYTTKREEGAPKELSGASNPNQSAPATGTVNAAAQDKPK